MTTSFGALRSLRTGNFALLWSAQVISRFGDKITIFALAFVTWQLTHSALSTVLSIVLATLPYAIFGFVGGAIADALGHRRVMVACDLARVAMIGMIPGFLALDAPLAVPYLLVLLSAMCSAVFNPARLGLVPDLVAREELAASNSMVFSSDRTVEILGALAAGAIVAVLGTSAFYLDAATFAVSAALLAKIVMPPEGVSSISWTGIARATADGVRFLNDNAVLRANTIFSLLAQLSIPVLNGLTPVLIFRDYALGPEQFGIVEAAQAAGAVGAGLTLPTLLGRFRKGRLLIVGFAGYGLVLMAIGGAPTFVAGAAFFVAAGIANVLFYIPNVTIAQERAPTEMRARVFGARIALLNLTWLPVVLAIGAAAELASARVLIAIAGAFTFLVALAGTFFHTVRDVD